VVTSRAEAQRGWTGLIRRFDAFAKAAGVVGGSAVLVRKGRIAARHDYGLADRAGRRPVTDRTIYHWASVTKTLTAIAVLQLRDRGLLTLDDRVTRWVPELRDIHDPEGWADSITIRMLLSHSSGLQSPTWPWSRGEPWEPFEPTRWEQLVAMMPYQRLHFRPGSRYGYSNPGYIYLARVIEKLSGDPWAVYVQKNLWTPLGMDRSYVGATPYHLAADRSHGYRVHGDSLTDGGADFDPGITIPNSGWNAPLADLARFVGPRSRRCGSRWSRRARRCPSSRPPASGSSRSRWAGAGSWGTPAIRRATARTCTSIRRQGAGSSSCSIPRTTVGRGTPRWRRSPRKR
jgi:CubicO group peptidase (beta-lactamase class C family)